MNRYRIELEHGERLIVDAEDSDMAVARAEEEALRCCVAGGHAKLYLLGDEDFLLGAFCLSGYSFPKNWREVQGLLSKIRQEALDFARMNTTFKVHRSRGVVLTASNTQGCAAITTADDWEFPKTLKAFRKEVERIHQEYPDVNEIWAECGVDSALSVRDLTELTDYEPWTGEASILIWKKGIEGSKWL